MQHDNVEFLRADGSFTDPWANYPGLSDKVDAAIAILGRIIGAHNLCIGWSAGKDSQVLLALVLKAMRDRVESGLFVNPVYVMHADTEIENPIIGHHARSEIAKIREFAEKYHLPVHVEIGRPYTSSSWAVRTIGQGKLPVWPGDKQDCTEEYKIQVQDRLRSRVLKTAARNGDIPVIVTGVRYEESQRREQKMRLRGDNAEELIVNKGGELYLAPIAEWDQSDVWGFLEVAGSGKAFESFSDFKHTAMVYASASPSSCRIIGDDILGEAKRQRGGCGARFGCWACVYVGRDRSMEAMIENDPDNRFMLNLNMIQRWLSAIRYDYDSRSWLPRSINEAGYIRIQPDLLGPLQVENLFKWVVTADVEEADAAAQLGITARFRVIDIKKLVAIDALWSQLGFFPPFHALKLYKNIVERGERYYAPEIAPFPRSERPEARYAYVGMDWSSLAGATGFAISFGEFRYQSGLDTLAQMFITESFESSPVTGQMFDVDEEGAAMFLEFEADEMISEYGDYRSRALPDITEGFKIYLRYGVIQLAAGQKSETEKILRRTYFRDMMGLTGANPDIHGLLSKSISKGEMESILDARTARIERLQEVEGAWSSSAPGIALCREISIHGAMYTGSTLLSQMICGQAYSAFAELSGYSVTFDGVDYAELALKSARSFNRLLGKHDNDPEIRVALDRLSSSFHTDAIRALDVHSLAFSFGAGFGIAMKMAGHHSASLRDSLRTRWSGKAVSRCMPVQGNLFAA